MLCTYQRDDVGNLILTAEILAYYCCLITQRLTLSFIFLDSEGLTKVMSASNMVPAL